MARLNLVLIAGGYAGNSPTHLSSFAMISEETFTILSQLTGTRLSPMEVENLFLHLNADDAFAPPAMVGGLMEMLQSRFNSITLNEKLESVFSDILARDRHTGFYIHPALRTLYLDFAIVRSSLPKQENKNFLIMGDFMNLSSVNDAIGRNATNDVMATICGIYLDCMTRAGVVNWLYHRSTGDEITFIVVNTPEEKVKKGLQESEKITQEFIQNLGLERLRHKKYPERFGSGLITSYVPLTAQSVLRVLKQQLDDAVKNRKRGKPITRLFSFTRRGIESDLFHNRSSELRVDKALHKYASYRAHTQQLNDNEQGSRPVRNPLHPVKSLLIGRAISWPRDDRIKYLQHHHDNTKAMLRADIYNLGGLNAVFGHDGADQIKSHLIRILFNTISAHNMSEPKIFDCGGGIIDVIINAMPIHQLTKMIETVQVNIYHQILSQSVQQYSEKYMLSYSGDGNMLLSDLPHPRDETEGTGLIMALHTVEESRSLPEIIERLDKITQRTKMHNFTFLWSEDDRQVYAFILNELPVPVSIGMDRPNPGAHYLPYTDALRHYLKQEDLPDIFERPVGQICETLFGTDMQAVLGFKKAIRKLQDKQIPDDTIIGINSYEEMDGFLQRHELPPLSVFSTQSRPVFVSQEHELFKTMALAEKLEGLPKTITDLILQAQASFRTLKLIQPHGHFPLAQAIQVLEEELQHQPEIDQHQGEHFTESLYLLARLLDRTVGVLNRDLPQHVHDGLRNYCYSVLQNLARAFDEVGETLLSHKLFDHVNAAAHGKPPQKSGLSHIKGDIMDLVTRIERKNLIPKYQSDILRQHLTRLISILDEAPVPPFTATR